MKLSKELIVPGWCAVYWIKARHDIEVLDGPDLNYWTTAAYRVPDKPNYTVKPGETGFDLIPVTRNLPRSFITNINPGDAVPLGAMRVARGIAFGGDAGVKPWIFQSTTVRAGRPQALASCPRTFALTRLSSSPGCFFPIAIFGKPRSS